MRLLPALFGVAIALASPAARAIVVTCSEGPAECTIDNEFPSFECSCNGQPGSGSTGASENPWADLSEEELMQACEEMLPDACIDDPSGTGGDTGTSGATGESATATMTAGDPTDGTSASESESDTNASGESDGDTDGGENGSSDGESDDEDDGCSIGSPSPASALALALLALGFRRRRA